LLVDLIGRGVFSAAESVHQVIKGRVRGHRRPPLPEKKGKVKVFSAFSGESASANLADFRVSLSVFFRTDLFRKSFSILVLRLQDLVEQTT
jgi:hypothetical protein